MSVSKRCPEFEKMKLLAHNKKFLIFYSLDADWIEDPESQSFDGFLSTISGGNPEIKTRIIESMGYLLSSCNKGKCFFVMGTAPNSGKKYVRRISSENTWQ